VPLTGKRGKGKFAIVDAEDYARVSEYKWYLAKRGCIDSRWYGKLHQFILRTNKDQVVDHINHNIFDNRKENLRVCTKQQNLWNMQPSGKGTSKYKGVCLKYKCIDRWTAQIHFQNKKIHIGVYNNETSAAIAYNHKAQELFGEYACINIID
jgi:hypothetical protein